MLRVALESNEFKRNNLKQKTLLRNQFICLSVIYLRSVESYTTGNFIYILWNVKCLRLHTRTHTEVGNSSPVALMCQPLSDKYTVFCWLLENWWEERLNLLYLINQHRSHTDKSHLVYIFQAGLVAALPTVSVHLDILRNVSRESRCACMYLCLIS